MSKTQQQLGRMRRTKGHNFERAIAAELRALWPGADIHRSSQAERAREADVIIDGKAVPRQALLLWFECQDAAAPTPLEKLAQAERDIEARILLDRQQRLPVVVWHKLRSLRCQATTRLWVLNDLANYCEANGPRHGNLVVTVDWEDFKLLLSTLPSAAAKEAA